MSRFVKQFLLNGTLRAGAMIVTVFLEAILVRLLIPAEYATWSIALSLSLIAIVFSQFGYQTSAIKIFSRYRNGTTQGFHNALLTAGAVWLFAAIALLIVYSLSFGFFFTGNHNDALFWSIYFMIISRGINTALAEGMRGINKIAISAALGGMGLHGGIIRVLSLSAGILLLYQNGTLNLENALWVSSFISSSNSVIILIFALKAIPDQSRISVTQVITNLKIDFATNFQLMCAQFFQLCSSRFTANLVGGALGLGQSLIPFILAQQISQLMLAPLTVLNGSIPNLLIDAHEKGDRKELEELMRAASTIAFATSLFVCIAVLIAGPNFFRIIFGDTQDSAYSFFIFLLPGILFNCYTGSAARALALLGEERAYAITGFITALFAVPIYILSGAYWNANGLAIASSVILIGQNIFYQRLVRVKFGVRSNASLSPKKLATALIQLRSIRTRTEEF